MKTGKRKIHKAIQIGALTCFATVGSGSTLFAQDNANKSEADRLRDLEQIVRQLQEQNADLKKELDDLRGKTSSLTTAPAVPPTAATKEGGKIPLVLPRNKVVSRMALEGILQANTELGDASSFEGRLTGGPNQIDPRVRLRRARIGVTGDFFDDFDFKLEGDFEQGDGLPSPRDAFSGTDLFINYHRFDEANFRIGQFMTPFGYEMMLPDVGPGLILLTTERSLANIAIVPERQVGAQLSGKPLANLNPEKKDLLTYWVGAFNGNNRNSVLNDNANFMWIGRLESVPLSTKMLNRDFKLRFGGSGLFSRDAKDINISQIGNLALQPDGSLLPFSKHSPDRRQDWEADGTLTWGPFELTTEYFNENVSPTSGHVLQTLPKGFTTGGFRTGEFTAEGYYVQPSLFVWKDKLQLVTKWESFDPGQGPKDDIRTITGGLNYYIHGKNVIAMLDYMHTWSDFREAHPAFGKDQFNEVLLRLELYY